VEPRREHDADCAAANAAVVGGSPGGPAKPGTVPPPPVGWCARASYTYLERFGPAVPLSPSLYMVSEPEFTRDNYRWTAAAAKGRYGSAGKVVPYISLGMGYRRNSSDFDDPFSYEFFDNDYRYDEAYSALLGAQMNRPHRQLPAYGPWDAARAAVFFPGPFDEQTWGHFPSDVRPGSTNSMDHFIAYCSGAAGSRLKLDDLDVRLPLKSSKTLKGPTSQNLMPADNAVCKNASADWPLPCTRPADSYQFRFANIPISAWWGPVGYGVNETDSEYEAYVNANFNVVQVSDRSSRCHAEADWQASWARIQRQFDRAEAHGMQSLVDTYRCTPWGGPRNFGGYSFNPLDVALPAGYPGYPIHKVTLPEIQWLAKQVHPRTSVVGLLITDDGAELAANAMAEIEWMKTNTPEILPWVNQVSDASEWLNREGVPIAIPELYNVGGVSLSGHVGNATLMCQQQLQAYQQWTMKSNRFNLSFWPIINIGDGGGTGNVQAPNLVRFQAYSALAYGAKGLMWYCWANGAWDTVANKPTAIYTALKDTNGRVLKWGPTVLSHDRCTRACTTQAGRRPGCREQPVLHKQTGR
jgi:hypothetical protein